MLTFFLCVIAGAIAIPFLIALAPLTLALAGVALLCVHQTAWGASCVVVAALWAHALAPDKT